MSQEVGSAWRHPNPIGALRLVHGTASVACRLPFAGVGLSRRVLDEALLGRAAQLGAEIRRGQVANLTQDRGPIVLDVDGAEVRTDTLFLATGKHVRIEKTPAHLMRHAAD